MSSLTSKLVLILALCSNCGESKKIVISGDAVSEKKPADMQPGTDLPQGGDAGTGVPPVTTVPPALAEVYRDKAFLHVNLWNKFHNFRSWCGPQKTFHWMCNKVKEQHPSVSCDEVKSRLDDCDVGNHEIGFIGTQHIGQEHCEYGNYPPETACDPRKWNLDDMRFHWYGAYFVGNHALAILKIFKGTGAKFADSGEVIGLNNMQLIDGRSGTEVDKRGKVISTGCTMETPRDTDRYKQPFGAFAWVEVPTGEVVTVIGTAGTRFGKNAASFSRDNGTAPVKKLGQSAEDYWRENPPNGGARQGYSIHTEEIVFEKGKQYYWGHGSIREVTAVPDDVKAGFALYQQDVTSPDKCVRTPSYPDD